MLIEGPLNIEISEPADGQGKILTVGFQPEFQALALDEQGRNFREYLDSLAKEVAAITGDNDRDRRWRPVRNQRHQEIHYQWACRQRLSGNGLDRSVETGCPDVRCLFGQG